MRYKRRGVNMIIDFLSAAYPWITIGIGVAITIVYINSGDGKNGRKN